MRCLITFLFFSVYFSGFLHDESIFLNGFEVEMRRGASLHNNLFASGKAIAATANDPAQKIEKESLSKEFKEKSSLFAKRAESFLVGLVSIRDGDFFVGKKAILNALKPIEKKPITPDEKPIVLDEKRIVLDENKITLDKSKKLDKIIVGACNKVTSKRRPDPRLMKAMIGVESGFNPRAVSPRGAKGLLQLMPKVYKKMGINPFDPKANVNGGTQKFSEHLDEFEGNIKKALAAYNAGPARVREHNGVPPFNETKKYVKNVLAAYNEYKKEDSFFR